MSTSKVSKGAACGMLMAAGVFASASVSMARSGARTGLAHGPPEATPSIPVELVDQLQRLPGELGALPLVVEPAGNPTTPAKAELGRRLFFDTRFSKDRSTSCATCHSPDLGFADGKPLAVGFGGQVLARHTPTVLNAAYNDPQFWDGRATGLEAQAIGPIMAVGEMNMGSETLVIERIRESPEYVAAFQEIFGAEPSLELVGKAIAAYERTLVTPNSRFDRYARGDKTALSDPEKRGLILFFGKASCTACHSGPNFTDNQYHGLGVGSGSAATDEGRFVVSKVEADRGAFKTPTVRNAAVTAPYMHDGSIATLEAVIDFYDQGGGPGVNKSRLLFPLNLTTEEKQDLIAFIHSLTGEVEGAAARAEATNPTDR